MTIAVLFDLDGTLLDSLADLAAAGNAVLRAHGYEEHSLDAYRYFVGSGIEALVKRLLPPHLQDDPAACRAYINEFRDQYAAAWNVQSRLYDGISEMLSQLQQRAAPLAIFSNKPHDFTELCVAHYLADFRFLAVCGVDQERPRKPDPRGAIEIARSANIAPSQWLYLGDTSTDMETARRAGMYSVGALWGFRDAAELQAAGARELIDTPAALVDIFDRHRAADRAN